jgi:hypothetical protein
MSDVFEVSARPLREAGGTAPAARNVNRFHGNDQRAAKRTRSHSFVAWLLICSIGVAGATQAVGQPVCKPTLTIKDVRFSAANPPTLERRCTATVSVDASRCATTAGSFEIVFLRQKETGLEVEFREQFTWRSPSVTVAVDFWADEAVEGYWIHNVAPCPCRT